MRTAALAGHPSAVTYLWLWARGEAAGRNGRRWTTAPETVRAPSSGWWTYPAPAQGRPGPQRPPGPGQPLLRRPRGDVLNFPNNVRELYARPQLDWDVAPFPKAWTGSATPGRRRTVGLPEGSKQVEPAWTFAKWLASADGARIFTRAGRAVPARRSAANNPDYLRPDTPQHEEQIVKALEYSRLQPVTLMFNDAEVMVRAYENAMFDEQEPLPVAGALQQLQDALDRLERDRAQPVGWEPKR